MESPLCSWRIVAPIISWQKISPQMASVRPVHWRGVMPGRDAGESAPIHQREVKSAMSETLTKRS